ncbi:MAG: N-acetylglutaminylglutamine synthetase [Desulfobacteraceae bacterium]|jgi:GNAT-family acetyltransferase (TIGR03103 family)|nr:N-acetylglutaminylglutamine synthetase [Desulfobacteraceae bacterium]
MENIFGLRQRIDRMSSPSLRSWDKPPGPFAEQIKPNTIIDMGWGSIIFGHTFGSNDLLFQTMCEEGHGKRDITLYLRDPHVILSLAPDKLFLDPSHTYRLWSHDYKPNSLPVQTFNIRRIVTLEDGEAMNKIYASRNMVQCDPAFVLDRLADRLRTYFIAESKTDSRVLGTVTGVDHALAFNDPENGASLWCLAADSQANSPGVGEALIRHLVEHYFARGRNYVDLSVMHDNHEAINLYKKLGFQRVPVFCVKRKNTINEKLYAASSPEKKMNPYARIIIGEARRRGVGVEIIDEDFGYFRLSFGGRSITCRESLTELTSAIAMSRCDDKRLTHRTLKNAGLHVPRQYETGDREKNTGILTKLKRVVVKPARGEQGNGISVDIRTAEELEAAIQIARQFCDEVIIEELVEGQDLRMVVIDYEVVAGAIRKPPVVTGTGQHTIKELIDKYNRRRLAATDGESRVPTDEETERCIESVGLKWESIPPAGQEICVRKTANLHTGGIIEDVTNELHPVLIEAAESAARALDIPVTGLDFFVPDVSSPEYSIIEANERPGLANHEPQPTAERFIDLLFPQTVSSESD